MSLRRTSALPSGPRQSGNGPSGSRTSSASLCPPGRPPPGLPPGARPRRCHCSLTSRRGPAPRPPLAPPTPSPPPAPGARDPRSLQNPGLAGLPPRPGRGCAPLRSPQLAFVIPAPFLASPPTPRRTAKHGARSTSHTWNPKPARGRSLPRLCREERLACARVCVQPVLCGRRL